MAATGAAVTAAGPVVVESLETRRLMSLGYTATWVGNSYGKGDGAWIQNNILGLYVSSNGTAYTNSWWDEGSHEGAYYRGTDGQPIGAINSLHTSFGGGFAVAGDNNFIYSSNWNLVRRSTLQGAPAPFAGGQGPNGDTIGVTQGAQGTDKAIGVQGLAVDKVNGRLVVSENTDNLVEIYNTSTMTKVRSWSVARPGAVTVAGDGTIWAISNGDSSNAARILHFDSNGNQLSQVITGSTGFAPSSVWWDSVGSRLLVGDGGPDQNIKIYSNLVLSKSAPDATFGKSIFSGTPGQVTNTKFGTSGITGVATDSAGNIYVSLNGVGKGAYWNGGGTVLESWTAAGTLRWRKVGLDFVDVADADTTTATGSVVDVYDKYSHYQVDLSKTTAGTEWTYVGHTLNPTKYPADQRFVRANDTFDYTAGTYIRQVNGHKLMYVMDMQARRILIYRFNPTTDGEVAIPAGIWESQYGYAAGYAGSPSGGDFIWRDKNGDGQFQAGEYAQGPGMPNLGYGLSVDSKGNIWSANHYSGTGVGIRQWKLQGFDANGNPVYDYSAGNYVEWQRPVGSHGDIRRVQYFPDTDTMYVSSTSDQNGDRDAGTRIVKYKNWSNVATRSVVWSLDPPLDNTRISSISIAGDYVFLGYSYFSTNSKEGTIYVYKASDGTYAGAITPTPAVGSISGTFDVPNAINAVQQSNGEYTIFAEDDNYAKVIAYRWNPTSNINLIDPLDDLTKIDTTRTTAHWGLDGSNTNLFSNDNARSTRTTDTAESIVWQNKSGIVDFAISIYYGQLLNIDSLVTLSTSVNGTAWTPLTTARTPTVDSSNNGGWVTTTYRPGGTLPAGTQYVRVTVAPSGVNWNVQIGRAEFFGTQGGYHTPTGPFFLEAPGTGDVKTTIVDDLNNLSLTDPVHTVGAWGIDGSNANFFQNDGGRAIRATDATGALAWKGDNFTTFAATIGFDQSLAIGSYVTFYRSTNGVTWLPVAVTRTTTQSGGGGNWGITTFTPTAELPAGSMYLRLQIAPVGTNWKIQVGKMVMQTFHRQSSIGNAGRDPIRSAGSGTGSKAATPSSLRQAGDGTANPTDGADAESVQPIPSAPVDGPDTKAPLGVPPSPFARAGKIFPRLGIGAEIVRGGL